MIDWDNLQIAVVDPDSFVLIRDEDIYTLDAEQRMILFCGERGETGPQGPIGPEGPEGPPGPSGQGAWGTIGGDIGDQTDLQNALNAKASISSLGSMAFVNDAPSDGDEYVRKNGLWAIASGGGGGSPEWGDITGTLANQTDLQTALDAKTDLSVIAPAFSTSTAYTKGEYVIYQGKFYLFTSDHSAGSWNASHVMLVDVADRIESTEIELKYKASISSPTFLGVPEAPTASAGTNTDQLATTKFVNTALSEEILYYTSQTVSVASSAEIMRIPASGTNSKISTDTVVLECIFAAPENILSGVSWTSYAGYITFTGTCTKATTANVVLGKKGN